MSQQYQIQDTLARKRALDVTVSAIVSASAGSGKTGIVSQRHLACLLTVERPEQVLSMTFTRDAAAEMRHRIITALQNAQLLPRPQNDYEAATYDLAKKVLLRDKEKGWNIIQNPHRLSILTIDSLCAQIVKQVPILSGMGGEININDDPFSLYVRAATNVINAINEDHEIARDIKSLLLHLNGNQQRCVDLIASMLAKRDQWMRHVSKSDVSLDRDKMARTLDNIISQQASVLDMQLKSSKPTISELLDFACQNLEPKSPIHGGSEKEGYWTRVAHLFLTNDNKIRKSITKNHGFPAGPASKQYKDLWLDVAATLSENHIDLLAKFKDIPDNVESKQWDLLDSLFNILWRSAIELKSLFIQTGEVDFTEIAQRALTVLRHDGETEKDVQFKVFNWYRHILVDEVQDTNRTQYEIIESLVSEWDESMNNTLFMVGDPKQSIYRFREADVGLFMQARVKGVGAIQLEDLHLTSNFRSTDDIINWNNSTYEDIFPEESDVAMGAVPFSKATPVKSGNDPQAVTVIPLLKKSEHDEAQAVLKAVKESLETNPDGDIAVLVRARSHLTEIARTLFENRVAYHAVEIEQLSTRQVILDALNITKAVLHAYDNTAWIGVLRMPCIGFMLEDLTTLCENMGNDAIIERMRDEIRFSKLTKEGKSALRRLDAVMQWARERIGTVSIRQLIEGVWLQLGAPAGYSERDIRDVNTFFALLDEYGYSITIDANLLLRRLDQLYAKPKFNAATKVTLMTMHKSKGLEFDTVIMPSLGMSSRGADSSLVMLHEFTSQRSNTPELLIAPIKSAKPDPMYTYLMKMESEKDSYERMRLMYVGTTRAKKKLYLIGHIEQGDIDKIVTKDDLKQPPKSSLLGIIWSKVSDAFLAEAMRQRDMMSKEPKDKEDDKEDTNKTHGYGPLYFRRVKRVHVPQLKKDTHLVN